MKLLFVELVFFCHSHDYNLFHYFYLQRWAVRALSFLAMVKDASGISVVKDLAVGLS